MNKFNPKIHHHKSIRLKNYDYSQAGLYFITLCTQHRLHLFGEIVNDEMVLNDAGEMIKKWYDELENKFTDMKCREMIIMPNHFHGIIAITPVGAPLVGAQNPTDTKNKSGQPQSGKPQSGQPQGIAPTVGDIVGAFKSLTTNEYIRGVKNHDWQRFNKKLWQRNYWEHIIRNDNEHQRIAQYIMDNPKKWALDKLNIGAPLVGIQNPDSVCPNQVKEQSKSYHQEAWMI